MVTALLATICTLTFHESIRLTSIPFIVYVPLSLLLWLGARFGLAGMSLGLITVAVTGSKSVAGRYGVFGSGDAIDDSLHFQLFLLATCVPLLMLGSYIELLDRMRRTLVGSGIALEEERTALQREVERRRALAHRLISAQEEERVNISGLLHDDISQHLAVILILINTLKQKHNQPVDTDDVVDVMEGEANQVVQHVRQLSHDLHPAVLQKVGIAAALRGHCAELSKKVGIRLNVDCPEGLRIGSEAINTCLFRIAQEGLHNIVKHSGATTADITLLRAGNVITLIIQDHGCGFDQGSTRFSEGLGFVTMEERARLVGGTFDVRSMPFEGTTLMVRIDATDAC